MNSKYFLFLLLHSMSSIISVGMESYSTVEPAHSNDNGDSVDFLPQSQMSDYGLGDFRYHDHDAIGFRAPSLTSNYGLRDYRYYDHDAFDQHLARTTVIRPQAVYRCHSTNHWHCAWPNYSSADFATVTDYPRPVPRPARPQDVGPTTPSPPQRTVDQCTQTDAIDYPYVVDDLVGPYRNRGNVRSVTRRRMQLRGIHDVHDNTARDVDCLVIVLNHDATSVNRDNGIDRVAAGQGQRTTVIQNRRP